MANCFSAQQTVRVELAGSWAQVQAFLQEPRHLTAALLDQGQVRQLDRECFEVRMRWIGALGLQVRPIVRLRIQTPRPGEVRLQAIGCRIEGNDWIHDHFDLAFEGSLLPLQILSETPSPRVILQGQAQLQVGLELPPLLALTPSPLVETVGTTIVKGVLMTIRHSLSRQLPQSCQAFVRSRSQDRPVDLTPVHPSVPFSPNPRQAFES